MTDCQPAYRSLSPAKQTPELHDGHASAAVKLLISKTREGALGLMDGVESNQSNEDSDEPRAKEPVCSFQPTWHVMP